MNYFEHHIGDYLKDTAHLSLLEHGIYRRLMDVYYTRESAVPAAEVARLIGARSRDEREALHAVLGEFFVLQDDRWTQARCDAEIARYLDKQRKAKAAADARWSESGRNADASSKHPPNADAPGMRTHSERNATRARPQSPDTKPNSEAELPQGESPRGSRLPADWVCPPEWVAYCRSQRPELDPTVVACNFADYWHGKAGAAARKVDWLATWRTWVRKEDAPKQRVSTAQSFRAQDERAAAEKVAFLTGRRAANTSPQGDFIEAEVTDVTPRALG